MFRMILQMSAIVALYVVLTTLIWKNTQKHRPGMGGKVLIGVLYAYARCFPRTSAWTMST